MRGGAVELRLLGQTLMLLPERAMFWRERQALLVADAHWGKAAAFRARGVPVPRGTTLEGLRRLTAETCDALVSIPMFGSVESLNVSVASGICLYEVRRQRNSS